MRRVSLLAGLVLGLAGCPEEPPPPTTPADPPAPVASADVAAPATPAPPTMMEELAALEQAGPLMTFDHAPATSVSSGDITVVLERVAMLRRSAENLKKEPWSGATSEAEPQGHYLALQLGIEVGGKPWTELPPGEQVGEIRLLGIAFGERAVAFESSSFEPLPDAPRSAYHYRRIVPPDHEDGKMVVTVLVAIEGRDPVELDLPPFWPLRKDPVPASKPPEGEKPPPEEPAKPLEEPKKETGDEEH